MDDRGDGKVGIVGKGVGKGPLVLGFEQLVEVLAPPRLEFGHDRLDVQAGNPSGG